MTNKPRILFMCVANSARSQLAEALAKQAFGDGAEIRSAGSRPTQVNPYAVRVLSEAGADHQSLVSKSIADLPADFVANLDYVITLCAEEVCPIILSPATKLHWPLPDPAGHAGSDSEQMDRFRATRDAIARRLGEFAKSL